MLRIVLFFILWVNLGSAYADESANKPFYVDNLYFMGENALEVEGVRAFFNKMKEAVSNGDIEWLSESISYPIRVYQKNNRKLIKNAAELKSNYEQVFNETIGKALQCQNFDRLEVNWEGIVVGQGAIGFNVLEPGGRLYGITSINQDDNVERFVSQCEQEQLKVSGLSSVESN